MDKVLNWSVEVNKFELQVRYSVHFLTNNSEEGIKPFMHRLSNRLNSIIYIP